MTGRYRRLIRVALAGALACGVCGQLSAAPIAGIAPDRRSEGAPRITTFAKDHAWYAAALSGLSEPYPASFRFLEDQGAWFTPFTRPGMTGPYDLRARHHAASARQKH